MREILFRAFRPNYGDNKTSVMTEPFSMANLQDKDGFDFTNGASAEWDEFGLYHVDTVLMQYTEYKMFDKKVFFGDLVSNNFKTDKEVIREIVMHEGCIMMKRVKGKSSLPKYINLHEWCQLNFRIVGDIYQDKHLLK